MECFSDDKGAVQRQIWSMSGIEFDRQYFVRLVKIEDPDCPPPEPKTIIKARNKGRQLKLQFPNDDTLDNEPAETPLHQLYPIVAGYVVSKVGLITALYFIDQVDDTVRGYRQLDNTSTNTDQIERESTQLSKTTFTLKPNVDKKDKAQ